MKTTAQQTQNYKLQKLSMFKREDRYHSYNFDRQIAYRYLFRLSDGHIIESAAYQHFLGDTQTTQDLAIDISTMVGCPMGCKFCESASVSYVRPLTVSEMMSQVIQLVKEHDIPTFPQIMCSFQGIGEPSLIPNVILEASRHLLNLDQRFDISIATIGARLNAFKLWRESGVPICNLQISYSGTTTEQISWVMPGSPALDKLLVDAKLCAHSSNFHQVKFNYVLIQDFNDSDQDVRRLISLFKQTPIIVKISALNPTIASQRHGLMPSSLDRAQEICRELQANGINSFVHGSFNSMNVSCGQLTFIEDRSV